MDGIRVVAFDVFGTTVDWWTGVAGEVGRAAAERGVDLDGGAFAGAWRARYGPSLDLVRRGELPWQNLDALHRRSLDQLLDQHGVAAAFDDAARTGLVRAWHRLPAWPDSAGGLARLRTRYTVAAASNGGFALLTNLVKAARLPFDCVVSAELLRHYKPDPQVYLAVAGLLEVAPDEVLMVAAHGADLAGARAAGLRTAFVERPLEQGPHGHPDTAADADLVAADFADLAARLGC